MLKHYIQITPRLSFILLTAWLSISITISHASDRQAIKVHQGSGIIWSIAFLDNNNLIFTRRSGKIGILDLTSKQVSYPDFQPRVFNQGQGGLLDVAPAPDFQQSRRVFFTYSKPLNSGAATTLASARIVNNQITEWKDLMVTDSESNAGQHYGSRITFDNQGFIYFGIGDRGDRDKAQDLSNHAGTIVRLNPDGSIPADNPFVNNPEVATAVWSYGHRNPQGIAFDTKKKLLWEIEHGPRGGDEINLIKAGKNYGWPVVSHGKEYWAPLSVGEGTEKEGMENPTKVYIPSIAPSSLIIYRGNRYKNWDGNLFAGALKLRHLNRVILNDKNQAIDEERLFKNLKTRIRGLTQSPNGIIYFSTDSGAIYKINPDN